MAVALTPGEQVGQYRVECVLGSGATALVYRAIRPDGVAVALKLILPELSMDETFARRFELEVSIAQRVKHPNVVPVLDSGEHEGSPWLTQALVPGGSLVEKLKTVDALPVADAVDILQQVAGGLDAVHASGLVHRDVKPANILLECDGRACITDFGMARDTESDRRFTRPGQTIGSMDYMAPEQIEAGDVGPFTDVYALGCVIYECVVGMTPFGDRPGMGVLMAHLDDEPAHPSDRRPGIPRDVGDAVLLALAMAPADRPASASKYAELVSAAAALPA